MANAFDQIANEIMAEYDRQKSKWDIIHPVKWMAVLGAKVGESDIAGLVAYFHQRDQAEAWGELRLRFVQVGAVCMAALLSSPPNTHLSQNPDLHAAQLVVTIRVKWQKHCEDKLPNFEVPLFWLATIRAHAGIASQEAMQLYRQGDYQASYYWYRHIVQGIAAVAIESIRWIDKNILRIASGENQ